MQIIGDVLDLTELREVREMIGRSKFVDGATTAGKRAKRVKANEQLAGNDEAVRLAKQLVLDGLRRNPTFQRVALPKQIQLPMISRYGPGMRYGRHVDDAVMGRKVKHRTDLSVTVFLNDPGDYDGGELVLESPLGDQEIKLPAGSAILYPSGDLHHVAEVVRGERLAAVTWVQSLIRDAGQRQLLAELRRVCKRLAEDAPDWDETDLAHKTYSNLLRRWAEN